MKTGFIYRITNKINNKVYIGKTELSIKARWRRHLDCVRKKVNRYLYDAINKYGIDNFSIEVIESCSINKLSEREKYWIKFYKSQDKNFGYNMQEGGLGGRQPQEVIDRVRIKKRGFKHSIETRLKMSKAKKGKFNHSQSEETRKKLSEIFKNRPMTKGFLERQKGVSGVNHPNYKNIDKEKLKELLIQGRNNREIAKYFNISLATVIEKSKLYFGVVPSKFNTL